MVSILVLTVIAYIEESLKNLDGKVVKFDEEIA
jgi:hypothetical protein